MAASIYRIPDEPLPTGFSKYVVDPMWPLLAIMLSSTALGLAWFVFNGIAMGNPRRRQEWGFAIVALGGSAVLVLALGYLEASGQLQGAPLRYATLLIVALKLSMGYALYLNQQGCHDIWTHYENPTRNGLPLLVLMALAGRRLVSPEVLPPFLAAVLQ